jgi:hypothetical protein
MRNRSLAVWAVLLVVAGASVARGQPLTDRLPATTMIYVGWSPNASLQTTATAKMLADERFVGPWRRLLQEVVLGLRDSGVKENQRVSEHLPKLLLDAAQCEGCYALLEIKHGERHDQPQSVLMIDLGARRKSFEEHFEPINQRMKARVGDRLKLMKLEKSWVYTQPDRDGKPRLTWGFVGDTFVMFFGEGARDFVPRLVKGKFDASLHDAPQFVDCVGKVPGDAVLTTYLDAKGALRVARQLLERGKNNDFDFSIFLQNWDKFLNELGLDNITGVAEKTAIEDKQFVTRTLVRTKGAPTGLLGVIAQPAVDEGMIKTIPRDAMAAMAVRLDLATGYDKTKASLIRIGGNDAKQAFDQLENGAQQMGLSVKTLFEGLGDQWVVYNATSRGGFALTGWTVVTNVRDRQKLDKSVGVLRQLLSQLVGGDEASVRLKVVNADGLRVEYLEFGRWSFVSPAWTVVGDKLVMALYPQLVEDAARQISQQEKSLLDNPQYVAARKRTGDAGPMFYTSGARLTENVYPILLPVVAALNGFGEIFNHEEDREPHPGAADLLPSMQRLMDYVGDDAIGVTVTPDGLLKTRTIANPLLSPMAWVDSPVIWLALSVPAMEEEASNEEDRTRCLANMRQIGQAVILYANENNGKFPTDLPALIKAEDLTPDLLKSPYGPAKEGADVVLAPLADLNLNKLVSPATTLVAYDKAALESGEGTAAVYADGHCDWLTAGSLKTALDEANKRAGLEKAAP